MFSNHVVWSLLQKAHERVRDCRRAQCPDRLCGRRTWKSSDERRKRGIRTSSPLGERQICDSISFCSTKMSFEKAHAIYTESSCRRSAALYPDYVEEHKDRISLASPYLNKKVRYESCPLAADNLALTQMPSQHRVERYFGRETTSPTGPKKSKRPFSVFRIC